MKSKVIVCVRVRDCDYLKIKDIAEKEERKPTELIRLLIENYVKSQDI